MRKTLIMIGLSSLVASIGNFASAQSLDPAERAREQALLEQQSRVEFARKRVGAAEDGVKRAEMRITEAQNRRERAERDLRDANLAADRVAGELEVARGQVIKAQEAYELESERFQALRRTR